MMEQSKKSMMNYNGREFSIYKNVIKNIQAGKINFSIYNGNIPVANIYSFNRQIFLSIASSDWVIPAIIYISILSRKFEFESFEEAESTISRCVDFCNNERVA
jgi:hypothetical protein